jgi:hypothetical protein
MEVSVRASVRVSVFACVSAMASDFLCRFVGSCVPVSFAFRHEFMTACCQGWITGVAVLVPAAKCCDAGSG